MMSPNHTALDLVSFILADQTADRAFSIAMLENALLRECEPLQYLSLHTDLSEDEVYARAAQWCGIAFAAQVPRDVPSLDPGARPDAIGQLSSIRTNIYGRDVLFTSSGLQSLVRIKENLPNDPDLARRICLVPPRALRASITDRASGTLLQQARTRLGLRWPSTSSHLDVTLPTRIGFVLVLCLLLVLAAITPFYAAPILLPLMAFLLLVPSGIRLVAGLRTLLRNDESPIYPVIPEEDLPVYTILVPLRDEANMVQQLAWALGRLQYPAEKLDIKFVVESKSIETLNEVSRILDDPRFELVIVPDGAPATKPKALNYALPLARGEFAVIYDAEDVPDPDQLRRVAHMFRGRTDLDCIQAELVIENSGENWLSALFAGEYGGQFGLVLPALASWHLPMPLGGTSNHFRLRSLLEVGGWDAFNVTEDADLGVRLSRLRYRSGTIDSQTLEEAPLSLTAWMAQRTRWIKGWMQTFLVHNRHPVAFWRDIGWINFITFQAYVGGMIVSAPLHFVFLLSILVRIALGLTGLEFPSDPWIWLSVIIFLVGYVSSLLLSVLGLWRLGKINIAAWSVLLPFYWLFTSIAAVRALLELLTRPHFWAKTKHGLTRQLRGQYR